MSFWEKMQKDITKNIQDGIAALKEGGSTVSKKIELLTEEGKKKYRIYSLQVHVKEEFEKLGIEFAYPTTVQYNKPLPAAGAA